MNTSEAMAPHSRDPAFKLFGRKIPVPETRAPVKDKCSEMTASETEGPKETNSGEPDKHLGQCQEENEAPEQVNKVIYVENNNADQEKVFKKTDKVLPCPRCNSLDTKFCYFNNYNVNQPRHFCKNCQRYWTAGGTVRNVPIGAGRRKNKLLASQFRQIIISSDGKPIARIENTDSANHQRPSSVESVADSRSSTGNGIVLKFGSEAPLCESMETVLNIGDRNKYIDVNLTNCRDNGDEPSTSGSTVTASRIWGNELPAEVVAPNEQVGSSGRSDELCSSQPVRSYSAPTVFASNPGCNNLVYTELAQYSCAQSSVPNRNGHGPVQNCPTSMLTGPGFCTPSIPLQFVPVSYWGCMPVWTGSSGNMPLNGYLSPSSSTSTGCCSGNESPTLGKHSRDSNSVEEEKAEKYKLVPKIVRFDDPTEG